MKDDNVNVNLEGQNWSNVDKSKSLWGVKWLFYNHLEILESSNMSHYFDVIKSLNKTV